MTKMIRMTCVLLISLAQTWVGCCAFPLWGRNSHRQHFTGSIISSSVPISVPGDGIVSFAVRNEVRDDIEMETRRKAMERFKQTLKREYESFFSPMEREFYSREVTFDDPLTSLVGIDSYERNVNMLSGKNWMGRLLFRDASIVLHKVEGGEIRRVGDGRYVIDDLITHWTLSFTFQALPWQPTARFSGISVYSMRSGGSEGVEAVGQNDYWDSINLRSGGIYQKVDRSRALSDFLGQLLPRTKIGELPYQLLRRGSDYEVRRYPSFVALQTGEDWDLSRLSNFCRAQLQVNPLEPSIRETTMTTKTTTSASLIDNATGTNKVENNSNVRRSETKTVHLWPLASSPKGNLDEWRDKLAKKVPSSSLIQVTIVPERVVAARSSSTDSQSDSVGLRQACERDGLKTLTNTVSLAQYPSSRQSEVWSELEKGSLWS